MTISPRFHAPAGIPTSEDKEPPRAIIFVDRSKPARCVTPVGPIAPTIRVHAQQIGIRRPALRSANHRLHSAFAPGGGVGTAGDDRSTKRESLSDHSRQKASANCARFPIGSTDIVPASTHRPPGTRVGRTGNAPKSPQPRLVT
jgi:hypothetical protein